MQHAVHVTAECGTAPASGCPRQYSEYRGGRGGEVGQLPLQPHQLIHHVDRKIERDESTDTFHSRHQAVYCLSARVGPTVKTPYY